MKSLELTFSKILLFVFLIGNFLVIAQNNQISEYVDHYSHIIPETPNASTFTKYGGTSLNLSKGIPNINIPLYNISIDGVTIPISMSYDASGIKTNDLATAVGLKWRLNTGGGIFFKASQVSFGNNYFFFLISFISLQIVIPILLNNRYNLLLFILILLNNPQYSMYHKYFDPFLLITFFTIFSLNINLNKLQNKKFFLLVFFYFLSFLIVSNIKFIWNIYL